jgi:hypothetical protein
MATGRLPSWNQNCLTIPGKGKLVTNYLVQTVPDRWHGQIAQQHRDVDQGLIPACATCIDRPNAKAAHIDKIHCAVTEYFALVSVGVQGNAIATITTTRFHRS